MSSDLVPSNSHHNLDEQISQLLSKQEVRTLREKDQEILMEESNVQELVKEGGETYLNRVKAKAAWSIFDIEEAYEFAKKGIPIANNGDIQVARDSNREADFTFAHLLSLVYMDEDKWNEALQCQELYAQHIPPNKSVIHDILLKELGAMKEKESAKEKMIQELLEEERKIKDEKKGNKRKKNKKMTKTSLDEVKEESECVQSEREIEASSLREAKQEKKCVEFEASSREVKEENESNKKHADEVETVNKTIVYHILRSKKLGIFIGFMGSHPYMEEYSFIPANCNQLVHYSDLKLLGSASSRILHIYQMILGFDGATYLVVEPINLVFENLMNYVITELDKSKWWTMIADLFQRLFSVESEREIEALSLREAKQKKECVESEASSREVKEENESNKKHAHEIETMNKTIVYHISRSKKQGIFIGFMGSHPYMEEYSFF